MTLVNSDISKRVRIIGFAGDPLIIERLIEMGLYTGMEVERMGRAPFNGPFLFRFESGSLALREGEAQCVLVEAIN